MLTISGYQAIAKIYESGNSLVYRGRRAGDERPVILKLLRSDYPSQTELTRYRHEYAVLRNLDAPGVVRALDLCRHEKGLLLVLEDFGGHSLAHHLQSGRFDAADFLPLAIGITRALHDVHQNRIIHKDITPSNIVFNREAGTVKIIDFAISTQLSREELSLKSAAVIEGTLAYISPEQTGRMNRSLDHRADLYSLGATFYELLTGAPPFDATDAMELVHCHIARDPAPPRARCQSVPEALSDLVMKLMAKTAEDRYQSTAGLLHDLEECQRRLDAAGEIAPFPLGSADASGDLRIPQQLYGRQREVQALLEAFDRVARGGTELMLIAGYSGVGKSALAHELYRPITAVRGYFVAGKYDQLKRSTPYTAITSAFRDLVRQIVAEPEAQFAEWRSKIKAALGVNGQVLVDVIPEIELIVGEQPPVQALGPAESQNRFVRVLQNFVRVFCDAERPLAVFLDDLQWADAASLRVIELLMTDAELRGLLVIGAYRDNEVGAAHPLSAALAALRREGAVVREISPGPLSTEMVCRMLADALRAEAAAVMPLAALVARKTGGNPFFVNEFLRTLHQTGCLRYDAGRAAWTWDVAYIESRNITDNVVDLMIGKLRGLPPDTQRALMSASCLGNRFDLGRLAVILEETRGEAHRHLLPALHEGLIVPLSPMEPAAPDDLGAPLVFPDYRFLHDRVQQAAYAMIEEDERSGLHADIGRLLLRSLGGRDPEEKVFDIVYHLNRGADLLRDAAERRRLAELNLLAGRRALLSAAFDAARGYFAEGLALLPAGAWESDRALTSALHVGAAEAACMNADWGAMKELVDAALCEIHDVIDRSKLYQLQILYHHTQAEFRKAVDTAVEALAQLGETFPASPGMQDFLDAYTKTTTQVAALGQERLGRLPPMTEASKQAALVILRRAIHASYFAAPEMLGLFICRALDLTMDHGESPLSSYALAAFSVLVNAGVGDIRTGSQFGELAIEVHRRRDEPLYKASVYNFYYGLSRHFYRPARESQAPLIEGYLSYAENGDAESAAYCLINAFVCGAVSGQNLLELESMFEKYIEEVFKFKQEQVINQLSVWRQVIRNLTGRSELAAKIKGEFFDAEQALPRLYATGNFNTVNYIHTAQAMLYFVFGEYELAYKHASETEPTLGASTGKVFTPLHTFYYSLAMTALYPAASPEDKERYRAKVSENQAKLKALSETCASNFLHRYLLVEAELAWLDGRVAEALDLYDRAIASASENDYVNEAAVACELAGRFWLAQGKEKLARVYLADASYHYGLWGAVRKAQDLQERYPQLAPREAVSQRSTEIAPSRTFVTTTSLGASRLDLRTVLKAAQAISGEIVLDRLLAKLMSVAMENAGAQRGCLVLRDSDGLRVDAEVDWTDGREDARFPGLPLDEAAAHDRPLISAGIVQYVARTGQSVVLADASADRQFQRDDYVAQRRPRSVLCTPIIHHSGLYGAIYLENNTATGTFTQDRLELLTMLSSQMAISIENAKLYTGVEQKVRERTAELEEAHATIVRLEREAVENQMAGGFAHEMRNALSGAAMVLGTVTQGGETVCAKNAARLGELFDLLKDDIPAGKLKAVLARLGDIEEAEETLDSVLCMVGDCTARALSVTNSILEYSKLGVALAGSEVVSLRRIVESVAARHRDEFARQGVSVELDLRGGSAVLGYESHFDSIVNNIVLNARDALLLVGDGRRRRVRIETIDEGEFQVLTVSDNADGISADNLAKIFQPFFSTKPTTGVGLGLSFVSRIVAMYQGTIDVESDAERGTTFVVRLPRAVPRLQSQPAGAAVGRIELNLAGN
ncbi:trifunctional serine/threonine-protein kinase/ATP-binding protein/sensor histidine kinase [Sorangium sp. So ce1078]|uniref:trifunctional serine/threonine-protein kinase/ATP-binding protein/sensor histidine kinase n=1 Tax=Sorangium sp. So ce1078 TaxID=3133329 RepID=UPI003F637746